MNTQRRQNAHRDSRSEFPRSLLPVGNFREELLPMQARITRGSIDAGIWSTAVTMHHNTIDPTTGKTWHGRPAETIALGAFEQEASNCQTWAIEQSASHDEDSLRAAEEANQHVDGATTWAEHTDTLLDDGVAGPDGAQVSARELMATHKRDKELAAARSTDGDTRHLQRSVDKGWFVLAAGVLALLDVFLLWRPVLALGFVSSSGMLFKWLVGSAFATGQALFIERSLAYFRNAERDSVDRRGALTDYNRAVRLKLALGDPSTALEQQPDLDQLAPVDRKLTLAHRLLFVAASFTAAVGGVRVAYLARQSGLPVVEAALFAAIVGLTLGGLVVLLGWVSRRGNQLGDRLALGGQRVAEVEARIQEGRGHVAAERDAARDRLAASDAAAAAGDDLREQITAAYRSAVLLACSWIGVERSILDSPTVVTRPLPIATRAKEVRDAVVAKLITVGSWLDGSSRPERLALPAAVSAGQSTAVPEGASSESAESAESSAQAEVRTQVALSNSIAPPRPGQKGIVLAPGVQVPPEPTTPHAWLLVGALVSVLLAVAAAFVPIDTDSGVAAADVISTVNVGR